MGPGSPSPHSGGGVGDMRRGKSCRWWAPSLPGSFISRPGSAEAQKGDLSDGPEDQSTDVLRTEEEKGKENSIGTGITGISMVEPEPQRKRPGALGKRWLCWSWGGLGPCLPQRVGVIQSRPLLDRTIQTSARNWAAAAPGWSPELCLISQGQAHI